MQAIQREPGVSFSLVETTNIMGYDPMARSLSFARVFKGYVMLVNLSQLTTSSFHLVFSLVSSNGRKTFSRGTSSKHMKNISESNDAEMFRYNRQGLTEFRSAWQKIRTILDEGSLLNGPFVFPSA